MKTLLIDGLYIYLKVIAECLSEEEIAGLREMFKMIDTDNSGQITFEELKDGLRRFGTNLDESEVLDLMQSVSSNCIIPKFGLPIFLLLTAVLLCTGIPGRHR